MGGGSHFWCNSHFRMVAALVHSKRLNSVSTLNQPLWHVECPLAALAHSKRDANLIRTYGPHEVAALAHSKRDES